MEKYCLYTQVFSVFRNTSALPVNIVQDYVPLTVSRLGPPAWPA